VREWPSEKRFASGRERSPAMMPCWERVPVAVRGDTAVLGDGGDEASFSFFPLLRSVTFFVLLLLQQTSNLVTLFHSLNLSSFLC
jgi:hypothetical protein